MPGTPPTTPRLGLPRYDGNDRATFWTQVNAVSDLLDTVVQKVTDPPAAGLVKDASVAADAAIAESKLALATDASPNVGSRRTLGTGANQAAAGNDPRFSTPAAPAAHASTHEAGGTDEIGVVPIGGLLAYAGTTLPPGGKWVWADGGTINRTTYATFFSRVGHAYNQGTDPGTGIPTQGAGGSGPLVKLPDKRGRAVMGADDFGQGPAGRLTAAAPSGTALPHPVARGQNGGVERTLLSANQSGVKAHNHVATQPAHHHTYPSAPTTLGASGASGGTLVVGSSTANTTADATPAITVNNATAAPAIDYHDNLPPVELDNWIIRVA